MKTLQVGRPLCLPFGSAVNPNLLEKVKSTETVTTEFCGWMFGAFDQSVSAGFGKSERHPDSTL